MEWNIGVSHNSINVAHHTQSYSVIWDIKHDPLDSSPIPCIFSFINHCIFHKDLNYFYFYVVCFIWLLTNLHMSGTIGQLYFTSWFISFKHKHFKYFTFFLQSSMSSLFNAWLCSMEDMYHFLYLVNHWWKLWLFHYWLLWITH